MLLVKSFQIRTLMLLEVFAPGVDDITEYCAHRNYYFANIIVLYSLAIVIKIFIHYYSNLIKKYTFLTERTSIERKCGLV